MACQERIILLFLKLLFGHLIIQLLPKKLIYNKYFINTIECVAIIITFPGFKYSIKFQTSFLQIGSLNYFYFNKKKNPFQLLVHQKLIV